MLDNIITVLLTLIILAIVFITGHFILYRRERAICLENFLFSTGIGFLIISYLSFLIGLLGFFYKEVFFVIFIFLTIFSIIRVRIIRDFINFIYKKTKNTNPILISFTLLLAIVYLLVSLLPETGKDSLVYHLAVPKLYIKEHRIFHVEGNIFSNYPFFMQMLYTFGMLINNDILPKLINLLFTLLSSLCLYTLSRRYLTKSLSFFSVLIFLTVPSIYKTATTTYVEMGLTFYLLLSIISFLNWKDSDNRKSLFMSALFTGVCMSIKYTAIFYLPVYILLILIVMHKKGLIKGLFKNLFLFIITAIIISSPWYIKNIIYTGNPFFPFLYEVFSGKGWDIERAIGFNIILKSYGMGRGITDYILLPLNLTFRANFETADAFNFDGKIGIVFFISSALFFLTLIFKKENIKISFDIKLLSLLFLLVFTFWAFTTQQIRFLVPSISVASLLTVFFLNTALNTLQIKNSITVLYGVLSFSIILNTSEVIKIFYYYNPISVISGAKSRDKYLSLRLPNSYPIFSYINKNLSEKSKIFFVWMKNYGFYIDRNYYSDSVFESHTIEKLLWDSVHPDEVYKWFKDKRFTHILIDMKFFLSKNKFTTKEESLKIDLLRKRFGEFTETYLNVIKINNTAYLFEIKPL